VAAEGILAGDQGQTGEDADLVYGMHCTWMPWHNLPHTDLQGYCSFHNPFLVVVVVVVVVVVGVEGEVAVVVSRQWQHWTGMMYCYIPHHTC